MKTTIKMAAIAQHEIVEIPSRCVIPGDMIRAWVPSRQRYVRSEVALVERHNDKIVMRNGARLQYTPTALIAIVMNNLTSLKPRHDLHNAVAMPAA